MNSQTIDLANGLIKGLRSVGGLSPNGLRLNPYTGFDTTFHLFGGQQDYFRCKTGCPQVVMTILFLDLMKNKAKFRYPIRLHRKIFKKSSQKLGWCRTTRLLLVLIPGTVYNHAVL